MLGKAQRDKRVVGVDAKAGPTYAIWGVDGLLVSRVLCAKVTGIHTRNI